MTDQQLLIGIMQNDERAWKYICRNMKPGFMSILGHTSSLGNLTNDDVEDIFREMQADCEKTFEQKDKEGDSNGNMIVRGSREFINSIIAKGFKQDSKYIRAKIKKVIAPYIAES